MRERRDTLGFTLLSWGVIGAVSAAFAISLNVRRPAFARPLSLNHEWLTASAVKFATSWRQDGPWRIKFALLEFPRAIDRSTISERDVYASYPPGQIIPIYLISLPFSRLPGPALVEIWNLFSHWVTSVACALLVFLMLKGRRWYERCCFSAIAGIMQIFISASLWFQQNVYGPDTAVIMPFSVFCLFLYSAVFRRARWFLVVGLGLISFYGCLTDWFFVVLAALSCGYLFIAGVKKCPRALTIAAVVAIGMVLAMMLFAWQLYELNGFNKILASLRTRTSSGLVKTAFGMAAPRRIWLNFDAFFCRSFCWWGIVVSLVPACLMLFKRSKYFLWGLNSPYAFAWGVILLPCLVYTVILPYHAAIHSFSVLKYTIPVSVLSALFFAWLQGVFMQSAGRVLSFSICAVLIAIGAYSVVPVWLNRYREVVAQSSELEIRRGLAVRRSLKADEVGVSPDFEIAANPPQALAYSRRCVYKVNDMQDVRDISAKTENRKIRIYFYNRGSEDLSTAGEQFDLIADPRPVKQFPKYTSTRVDPQAL